MIKYGGPVILSSIEMGPIDGFIALGVQRIILVPLSEDLDPVPH